ncbi:MAG: hypothetical protein PHH54_00250 [Candidatus Nanoarchaeia archaeon]|nr:hypothetical protein [Candidatus Nanoarchaeia archaeon]MDD5740393.1 hypothetical protein [Candidatus Nanoarchaeia archaeon]
MNLKKILKISVLPVAIGVIAAGSFLNFYLSNNNIYYDKESHFFQSVKTKGLFTKRIFRRYLANDRHTENFVSAGSMLCESYFEKNVLTEKCEGYIDEYADGSVDHRTSHPPFWRCYISKDAKDENIFFAKNRADFVKDMRDYGMIK